MLGCINAKEGEETILGILPFFHVYGMTTVLILICYASKQNGFIAEI